MLINGRWLTNPEIVCLIKQLEKENYELRDENLQLRKTIIELTKEDNND